MYNQFTPSKSIIIDHTNGTVCMILAIAQADARPAMPVSFT